MRALWSLLVVTTLFFLAPSIANAAVDAAWVNSLPCDPGGSVDLPINGSVVAPGATVAWSLANESGGTPAPGPVSATDSIDLVLGTTSGPLSPDADGFFETVVAVTCPVVAAGEVAVYTIAITSDAVPVASGTGAVTVTGESPPMTWVVVTPEPPKVNYPTPGDSFVLHFKVKNMDPTFPHTYDFIAEAENSLAPGLDLYDLTPISGFDLPTVIGAGTPLMTGKLEEIPPADELLLEILVDPPATVSTEGEGNTIYFVVEDDDSPAESGASLNGLFRMIEVPALGAFGATVLFGSLVLAATFAKSGRE